ncbi:MAG: hypothetical protein RR053_06835 [Evtepia sp.]
MTDSKKAQAEQERLEEYVEVKLFKDNKDYKDDVFVAVNGENCLIQRGQRVKIKKKFAQVIEQGELLDLRTAVLCAAQAKRFSGAAKEAGL